MQALFESILLAVAGGVAGLLVAVAAARLLLVLAFRSSHFLPINPWPSPSVLLFAFVMALLTGVIFGAAPAWFATRTDPVEALRGSGRSTADHSGFARKALLIVQAALSVVLVAGATMLARSLNKLEHQNFGYQNGRTRSNFVEHAAGNLLAAKARVAVSPDGGSLGRAAGSKRIRASPFTIRSPITGANPLWSPGIPRPR